LGLFCKRGRFWIKIVLGELGIKILENLDVSNPHCQGARLLLFGHVFSLSVFSLLFQFFLGLREEN